MSNVMRGGAFNPRHPHGFVPDGCLCVISVNITTAIAISRPCSGSGSGESAEGTGADIRLKKGALYELCFVDGKFAGAPADEHSVVVVHSSSLLF